MEDYLNQPKPKLPVAGQKFEIKEEEGDENWETELVEQSYNPLEVVQIYVRLVSHFVLCVSRPSGRRMF